MSPSGTKHNLTVAPVSACHRATLCKNFCSFKDRFDDDDDDDDAVFLLLLQEQLCMSVPSLATPPSALPSVTAQRSFALLPKIVSFSFFFSNLDRKGASVQPQLRLARVRALPSGCAAPVF